MYKYFIERTSEGFIPSPLFALFTIMALFILGVYYTSTPIVYFLCHYCSEPHSSNTVSSETVEVPQFQPALLKLKLFNLCSKAHIFLIETININTEKNCKIKDHHTINNYGRIIGFLERFVSIVLIVYGHIEGVVLLFAAKGLITSQAKNAKNTEGLLLGTMLSVIVSIIFGTLILWVLSTSGNGAMLLLGYK
ncbi:hypothetical protein [Methanorbis furvi]|uniref:hypothetical protein n=1 Tax=Methanorbis furvi TaxID=3028299 RepID=UPI0030B89D07